MALALCNLLGPLCTTHRFDDGSVIRRSSRESITYEHFRTIIHIEFYRDGSKGYEYYVPENITGDERRDLVQKVTVVHRRSEYPIYHHPHRTCGKGWLGAVEL
jgi:hypothetical protein